MTKPLTNPFPSSMHQGILFHGSAVTFDKFMRPSHGVFVTPLPVVAQERYGSNVIPLYASVTGLYIANDEETQLFVNRDYEQVSTLLERLSSEGYNACRFGLEYEMVLFNDIELVHAISGVKV